MSEASRQAVDLIERAMRKAGIWDSEAAYVALQAELIQTGPESFAKKHGLTLPAYFESKIK